MSLGNKTAARKAETNIPSMSPLTSLYKSYDSVPPHVNELSPVHSTSQMPNSLYEEKKPGLLPHPHTVPSNSPKYKASLSAHILEHAWRRGGNATVGELRFTNNTHCHVQIVRLVRVVCILLSTIKSIVCVMA